MLQQDITVTRPTGALVLTQVCATNGALPAEAASFGFPAGLPAVAADEISTVGTPTTGGTDPTLTEGGTDPDLRRVAYPYPTGPDGVPNPTYPTHCGLELGIAAFVNQGAAAGQFFAANGVLNQVTVVDTRDDDTGWTLNGTMSDFTANGGTDSFSGSQLGWVPQVTEDTGPFTDSEGNTYDQVVSSGGPVAPNSPEASGLTSGAVLASADATEGLGTAILDARFKLLIPVTADAGTYEGTLSITSV